MAFKGEELNQWLVSYLLANKVDGVYQFLGFFY
jgi:hypothetical protein